MFTATVRRKEALVEAMVAFIGRKKVELVEGMVTYGEEEIGVGGGDGCHHVKKGREGSWWRGWLPSCKEREGSW